MDRRSVLSLLSWAGLAPVGWPQTITQSAPHDAALNRREMENLQAYARLYGFVRHFHPSDEAEVADWDSLTVAGVSQVEGAATPEALARALLEVFRPVAPTLRVFPKDVPARPWQPPAARTDLKKVLWRHRGYRVEQAVPNWMNTWTRQRILAVRDGPPELVAVDLGAGVQANIPVTLLADNFGTLPYVAGREPYAPEHAPRASFTGNDRATRLAGVIIAWNAYEHFYPYFDVVKADWPKALRLALDSAATASAKEFLTILRRMTAFAHDGHTRVAWDADPDPDAVAPIGWDWVEDRLVITDVPDSQGQTLEPGDVVLAIDGKPTAEVMRQAEQEISAATKQWMLARALNHVPPTKRTFGSIGEGPASRSLVLEVAPQQGMKERRIVTLQRRSPPRKAVREHRPAHLTELKPGVLYVDLTTMPRTEWPAALAKMTGAGAVIFDFRGHPHQTFDILGHMSRSPMMQQRWYAPVITHPDRSRWEFDITDRYTVKPREPYISARKVFLTDGRAISFADSWMAMVAYYRLGDIVGEATAGTTGNANAINLPGGYWIQFTGQKVLNNDGSQFHGIGVQPTVPASRTLAGVAARRDEVLERALALLA